LLGSVRKYTFSLLPLIIVAQEDVDKIIKMPIIVFINKRPIMKRLSNFNTFILLSIVLALGCFVIADGQNTPYIPYNPKGLSSAKVYTDGDNKETISGTNNSDTIILMKNTISFHPTLLIDGTIAMSYERVVNNRKQAARVILGYSKIDQASFYESKVENLEQIYTELNYKFFLSRKNKKAPIGLYISPFVQFRNATYSYHVTDTIVTKPFSVVPVVLKDLNSFSIAAGTMLGYSTIVLEMITLEMYVGIGQQSVNGDYKINYNRVEYKPLNSGFFWNNGPLFKLGVSLGVNF